MARASLLTVTLPAQTNPYHDCTFPLALTLQNVRKRGGKVKGFRPCTAFVQAQ